MVSSNFWYFVISGFFLLLLPVVFIGSWWLKGFFWKYTSVKASQGKYLLVKIRSKLRDYYSKGFVIDGTLRFNDSKGNNRTVVLPNDRPFIYRVFGVYCVDVDEEKNCIYALDGSGVAGFDAEKFDDVIVKALAKEPLLDTKIIILIVLVCVVLLLLFAVIGFEYKIYSVLKGIGFVGQNTIGGL